MIINLLKYLTKRTKHVNIASDGLRNLDTSGDHDTVILNDNSNMTGCYTLYNTSQEERCIGLTSINFLTSRHHIYFRKIILGHKMSNIISFNFNNLEVRTTLINDEPYFCLKDVCEVLTIKNNRDVLNRLDKAGVVLTDVSYESGSKKLIFINEPNLYRVIFRSDKPEAIQFQDWVFDEVLPTLRKTGSYTLATQSSNPILDYDKVYTYELNNVFLPHTLHFRFDDRTTFAYLLDRDMFDCLGNGNYEGKGSFLPYFFKYSPDKAYDNFFDFADVLEIAHRKNTLKTNIFLYESRNILKWLQKLTGKKITPISRYVGTTLQRITA